MMMSCVNTESKSKSELRRVPIARWTIWWGDLPMNRELKPHYVSSLGLVYSILLLIPKQKIRYRNNHQEMKEKSINDFHDSGRRFFQQFNEKSNRCWKIFQGSLTYMLGNDRYTHQCVAGDDKFNVYFKILDKRCKQWRIYVKLMLRSRSLKDISIGIHLEIVRFDKSRFCYSRLFLTLQILK